MKYPIGECRGCEVQIVWATSKNTGKHMPLDALSIEKRAAVVAVADDGTPEVRIVDTFVPHHATCPKASEFRRSS